MSSLWTKLDVDPARWSFALLVGVALATPGASWSQSPHLSGEVSVDPTAGRITGDACLADLPGTDPSSFLLHRALTIHSVRDPHGRQIHYRGHADLTPVGVALQYTITDTLADPRSFCVRYTGAFPVHEDVLSTFDYQEVIAFDGRTVRAAPSTRWYPVPYDPTVDRAYEDVRYDLDVVCRGCEAVYVNGSAPRRDGEARFSSSRPWPLLLLAGDFPVVQVEGAFFLGDSVGKATARAFASKVGEITDFYEAFLGVAYPDTLVFLRVNPIKPMRKGQLWGFFIFPTLGTNVEFERFVEPGEEGEEAELNRLLSPYLWGLFAHETAHYYFGTLLPFRGPYAQFFGESAADYLALKAVEHFAGEEAYRERLRRLYEQVAEGPPPTPLDEITSNDPVQGDRYRYAYGPLLWVSLERVVGMERMRRLLAALLDAPEDVIPDYTYLRSTARQIGITEKEWRRWEGRCVQPVPAESCLAELDG